MKGKRESLQCQKSRLAFNLTHYKRSRSRALPCNRGDVELALQANWPLKSSERDCKKIQKKKKKEKKNTVNVYLAVEGIINFCTDENIMLRISDFVERLFFD